MVILVPCDTDKSSVKQLLIDTFPLEIKLIFIMEYYPQGVFVRGGIVVTLLPCTGDLGETT